MRGYYWAGWAFIAFGHIGKTAALEGFIGGWKPGVSFHLYFLAGWPGCPEFGGRLFWACSPGRQPFCCLHYGHGRILRHADDPLEQRKKAPLPGHQPVYRLNGQRKYSLGKVLFKKQPPAGLIPHLAGTLFACTAIPLLAAENKGHYSSPVACWQWKLHRPAVPPVLHNGYTSPSEPFPPVGLLLNFENLKTNASSSLLIPMPILHFYNQFAILPQRFNEICCQAENLMALDTRLSSIRFSTSFIRIYFLHFCRLRFLSFSVRQAFQRFLTVL